MASEYQILSAFKTWRDIARIKFNEDQLPTDEELLATAKDPDQLKPGGDYPALLVWATALRRVLGYVQVGTLHVIEQGTDAAMFTLTLILISTLNLKMLPWTRSKTHPLTQSSTTMSQLIITTRK